MLRVGKGALRDRHVYTVTAVTDTDCTYVTLSALQSLELLYPKFDEQIYSMALKRAERFGSTTRRHADDQFLSLMAIDANLASSPHMSRRDAGGARRRGRVNESSSMAAADDGDGDADGGGGGVADVPHGGSRGRSLTETSVLGSPPEASPKLQPTPPPAPIREDMVEEMAALREGQAQLSQQLVAVLARLDLLSSATPPLAARVEMVEQGLHSVERTGMIRTGTAVRCPHCEQC